MLHDIGAVCSPCGVTGRVSLCCSVSLRILGFLDQHRAEIRAGETSLRLTILLSPASPQVGVPGLGSFSECSLLCHLSGSTFPPTLTSHCWRSAYPQQSPSSTVRLSLPQSQPSTVYQNCSVLIGIGIDSPPCLSYCSRIWWVRDLLW